MNFLKANLTFFLIATLIVVSVAGYLWWRSGFTLNVNQFFAASTCVTSGGTCQPTCQATVQEQTNDACDQPTGQGAPTLVCCKLTGQTPTPVPSATPTNTATPTPESTEAVNPTPAQSDCVVLRQLSNDFVQGGVGVCRAGSGTMRATFQVDDAADGSARMKYAKSIRTDGTGRDGF